MDPNAFVKAFFTPRRATASPGELRLLSTGRQRPVEHDGHSLPTWTWGEGPGPRVLLSHGWDSRGSHLGAFVQPLAALGLSVTLFDSPAHGDAHGETSSVVHMGRALIAVARSFGDVAGLIGHSAGSAAALWAFNHGLSVSASVHLAGPATLENVMRAAAGAARLGPEEYRAFRARAQVQIGCPIEDLSAACLAPALRHAGLLVHDPEDPVIPFSESRTLHELWPTSRLIEAQGLGHTRILSDPKIVAECVGFVGGSVA